jgi:monoterpene epsilon-lactone hydrolase
MSEIQELRAMLVTMMSATGENPDLATTRAAYDGWGTAMPLPDGTTVTEVQLAHCNADLVTVPGADPKRALLYLHGGGYAIGSNISHRHLAAQLGNEAGCAALVVNYRLAPEHPFPAAVDDAVAGFMWLQTSGYGAARIAVAGDSAGGGLTVATALALKQRGLPQPGALFCISPWANLCQTGLSYTAKAASDPIVGKDALDTWAALYIAGDDAKNPLISPNFGDLSGLAPMLIHVGEDEVLLSDSIALAEAAGLASVDVTLKIAPQMIHVWHFFHASLTEARTANTEAGAWIKMHTEG